MRVCPSVKPPVVPRKQKIPDPDKKKLNDEKNLFSAIPESSTRIFSIYRFSDFPHRWGFLWSPVAPELGTDPRLDLARTAP
jgi:hypothetical protein